MTETVDTAQAVTLAGSWQVDAPHSAVGFRIRHRGGFASVRGSFAEFDGVVEVGEDFAASRFEATVQVASLSTRNDGRDATLLAEDGFDAERHPEIRFRSTGAALEGERVRIPGELTLRGVTREIVLEGSARAGEAAGYERLLFELAARIRTADFGFRDDEVELVLEISCWRE